MDIVYAEKYYKQVQERFPFLSIKQIDKIIKYGLRSYFMMTHHGVDVLFKSNYYTAYVGKLFNKPECFWRYYRIKWAIKLRLKYCRNKQPFNGKYYFILSKEAKENKIPSQEHKRGVRKQKYTFDSLTIYKIFDECALHFGDYIYELDYPVDVGFCKKINNFTISKFRLVSIKDENGNFIPVSAEGKNEKRYN